jgi:hypothetical protein
MINYHRIYPSIKTTFRSAISRAQAAISRVIPFTSRLNIHSALALAGILGPLVLAVADLTAAVSIHSYSLVRDSISSLALTSLGWLQTIGFLALGLFVEIFTAGLLYNVRRARFFHLGIGIFVFFGFAMLLIGAFHTDPVGGPKTFEGMIHGFAARVTFSLFAVAILALAPGIKKDPNWRPLFRYTIVTAILAVVLGVILRFFPEKSGWFGLIERILVANMILWVEVSAINLMRLSLKRGKPVQLDSKAKTG